MCAIYDREKSEPLERKLEIFRKSNDLNFTNETDIVNVCRMLKIRAVYMPLDDDGIDGLILINENRRVIGVNRSLAPIDVRFLIAHELGHYVTVSNDNPQGEFVVAAKDRLFHGKDKPQLEHDMDYLAAAILVPKEQFLSDLFDNGIDCKKFQGMEEDTVRESIGEEKISALARRYRVRERLILRRIVEVSYYA